MHMAIPLHEFGE